MSDEPKKQPQCFFRGELLIHSPLVCKECGGELVASMGIVSTLVGFSSPEGHDHDNNCKTYMYVCEKGHESGFSVQNECPACDWKGHEKCFCHPGKKMSKSEMPVIQGKTPPQAWIDKNPWWNRVTKRAG